MNGPASRRAWLIGIGAAAAAAGAAWYARRGGSPADPAEPADSPVLDLWSQRFARPEGGELIMATLRGRPLLINFWATWCAPCVRELPEIERFWRGHAQQLAVIGLAIDSAEPVRAFLQKMPLSFAIGLAGMAGTDLTHALGNQAGALPFTVLLDANGAVRQRKLGETNFAELERWARAL